MALDFVAGCVGGAAGVLVGYPLDTVKVKIQTQDPSMGLKYKGTFDCLAQLIKQDGVKSLYRGMSSPLCGVAAINAITFGVYGNALRCFDDQDSIGAITLAGSTAGLIQTFVVSPMELIKTQMQVTEHSTIGSTLSKIYQAGGLRGALRGMPITFTREIPAFGIYFGSYEILIREFGESTITILTAGGVAGIASWLFTYPQDVIKSRLQADGFGADRVYRNSYDCLKKSVSKEGYACLTRGLGSSVIRAFPVNAATFYVYTFVMKYFGDMDSIKQEMSAMKDSIKWRIYPEQMLYACNIKPVDTTLNCLHSRSSQNKFNQYTEDSLTDIHSVISITKETRCQPVKLDDSHANKIRMSDFLLPSNLLSSSRFEKIYGFYYLLA